nr:hypothetical protein BaRGS_002320 [Batillaria attramentaria]
MTSDEKQHVVLIIGKTGNGKSTLGNILIGESVKEPFKVGRGLRTTTLETQCYESNDGQLKVVDTPDINEWHDDQKKQSEVSEWKHLTAPNPDAILLAVNCDVRYTPEEHAIYREIKKLWKEDSFCERLIVAFTFGDLQDQDIAEELKFSGQELKSVLEDAGERYIVFNGKASDDDRKEQRLKLLQKIGQDSVPGLLSTTDENVTPETVGATDEERRFLVVGKTGNGKSSLCNILVGKKLFKVGRGLSTTTTHTQDVVVSSPLKMKVVDTPDISEWHDDQKKQSEVSKWKHLTAPNPDAILLAVNCDVRYTPEEHAIYREIKKLWKEGSFCNRLIVAFTFGDLQDQDIAEELKFSGQELKSVLEDAGGRYVVFNSKASEVDKTQQRERLLSTLQMCKIPDGLSAY